MQPREEVLSSYTCILDSCLSDVSELIRIFLHVHILQLCVVLSIIINYRFLTTETNLKALYIFCCLFTTSSVKLFVVNVQLFVYNCVVVFFGKRKNKNHKTFHVLKMKAHFEREPHFENESSFRNPFTIVLLYFSEKGKTKITKLVFTIMFFVAGNFIIITTADGRENRKRKKRAFYSTC